MKQLEKDLSTHQKLLRATYQLLKKQDNSCYVLDVLHQTSVWDGVTGDGGCLLEEIESYLVEKGVDADYVPEVVEGM